LQTPAPKRRDANVEPTGNFVFRHQIQHHFTSPGPLAGPLSTKEFPEAIRDSPQRKNLTMGHIPDGIHSMKNVTRETK
jgi:hypothetical protein